MSTSRPREHPGDGRRMPVSAPLGRVPSFAQRHPYLAKAESLQSKFGGNADRVLFISLWNTFSSLGSVSERRASVGESTALRLDRTSTLETKPDESPFELR